MHFHTVYLATGAANHIGASGVTSGRSLTFSGLALAESATLLSLGSLDAASGALSSVDITTGQAGPLAAAALPYGGGPIYFGGEGGRVFASTAAMPESAHAWLWGTGLLCLVGARRRFTHHAAPEQF